MQRIDILKKGDENGNGMAVGLRLPGGLQIYGLPTRNFYGGHWDLGPTWNYVVMAERPFLVDAGRYGQGGSLVEMMDSVGIRPEALDFVLISHGHEDHDGGLSELVGAAGMKVKAHAVYERLIRRCPRHAPAGRKTDFPAKCWHCFMPESFYAKNCLGYHRVLETLAVDTLCGDEVDLAAGITAFHLPGHSPDCLAVVIEGEAIIVGDVVLPDISPWPTREGMHAALREVLGADYREPEALFGLKRYIRSLKKLLEIDAKNPDLVVLPAHRLYYGDGWNPIQLGERVEQLLEHHVHRCGAILGILKAGPASAGEIAGAHFESRQLEGSGRFMAVNEVLSHCELLGHCGDVERLEGGRYAATGGSSFEGFIRGLTPEG
jgi:glyoxylase-like metal-dependent hydrolase (beta-lactamase superfamily II)